MSEDDAEPSDVPHPRSTAVLFGHNDAERELLDSYRGGRIPHAWLIGGPPGIGKATLAYRMARFALAHPDPAAAAVQDATSLAVPADNPVARRIANEAHGDLLAINRVINDKTGKLYANIRVEDVRKSVAFFGSTAGEGGWRIAIVDTVDELQKEGENALLKILEEPPPRSLLFLVSNAPGRVLPTIRSRCRRLLLRPLSETEVTQAAGVALGRDADDAELRQAAAASDGSVARAIGLLDGPALALREKIVALLGQLPEPDPRALHALGDAIGGNEPKTLAAFMDLVNEWLSSRLHGGRMTDLRRLDQLAQTFEKVNAAGRDAEAYNLERKPLVFAVFGLLAEAARG